MDVSVGCISVEKLFKEHNLVIPDFQRPYDWNEEQVEQLVEDLLESYKDGKETYLLGNLVFLEDKNGNRCKIVDGQQRIITLALIFEALGEEKEILKDSKFIENTKSWLSLSAARIKKNFEIIQNRLGNFEKKEELLNFINKKIIFTYTKTKDIDTAFLLFDSQNTRGKPLKRKDLLKVHHVRYIDNYMLRREIARKWEEMLTVKRDDDSKDKLDELLELLALARKGIRGELTGNDLVEIDIYKEFKSEGNSYTLSNYNQPPIFKDFTYDLSKDEISFKLKIVKENCRHLPEGWKYIPFQIPQSIEGGEKFFYFVWKYFKLLNELEEKEKIFTALEGTWGAGNIYLKKIYKSLLLLFADKFGVENLKDFAVRLLILMTYFRIKTKSIRKERVVKFEWKEGESLDLYKIVFLKYFAKIINNQIEKYITYHLENNISKDDGNVKNSFLNSIKEFHSEMNMILAEKGKNWEIFENGS